MVRQQANENFREFSLVIHYHFGVGRGINPHHHRLFQHPRRHKGVSGATLLGVSKEVSWMELKRKDQLIAFVDYSRLVVRF